MKQLPPKALQEWLADETRNNPILLDVRESWEFQTCCIDGSHWIPMGQIADRLHELDAGREVVVICHHGVRSFQVSIFLDHSGFRNVYNLQGGVDAWARDVDPNMPKY
jgi:rhodanese-related sulfurtransferase